MEMSTHTVSNTKSQWIRKTFAVILLALGTLSLVGFIATIPSDPSSAPSGVVIVLASLVGGVMLYRDPRKVSVTQVPAEDRSGLPPLPPPPPGKLPFNRLAVWSFILSLYPIATPWVPIILGFVARSQIKERFGYGRVERGRGLATSAIVAGFVWTALLVLVLVSGAWLS
jgi:FtsH-binding integral membrane protein